MPKINRPRRGSLAYSPRKRAKSPVPKYQSWPQYSGEPRLMGFAGYKVGMTHIVMVDDHKNSPTEGKELMVPVTVVEVPKMLVAAVRIYTSDTYGKRPLSEIWADNLKNELGRRINLPKKAQWAKAKEEIEKRIESGEVVEVYTLMYTQPDLITGVPKKVPDLMEIKVAGGTIAEQFGFATSILGKDMKVDDIIEPGSYADITAITTGKGTQGPVKRWGIMLRKRKHSRGGKKRHIGCLGPWNPHHVRWQVPQMGQTGYQQRTEFNKRVLKIGENGADVTPAGGFLHYGEIRNNYVLIKGSVPGPTKRLIRIRPAIRLGEHVVRSPVIEFTSVQSKQG